MLNLQISNKFQLLPKLDTQMRGPQMTLLLEQQPRLRHPPMQVLLQYRTPVIPQKWLVAPSWKAYLPWMHMLTRDAIVSMSDFGSSLQ